MEKDIRAVSEREEEYGEGIWNYMKLDQPKKKADLIFVLGSIDLLPARNAAQEYSEGFAPNVLFTGGVGGRNYDSLPKSRGATTEAEMLAQEAILYGLPKSVILLEKEAKNTSENIRNSKKILADSGIEPKTIMVSHMPSAERRDFASLRKQWPGPEFIMTSPNVGFREYHIEGYQGTFSRRDLINDMLGDFQRVFVHCRPQFSYIFSQEELGLDLPSDKVKEAYTELIGRGFGAEQLVKDKTTGIAYEIFK
ncbi:MAG: YdcF family protein [Nanoarchaeota archaeon]|nr:YdcF family protein [Nanoarchaeota archaeon]